MAIVTFAGNQDTGPLNVGTISREIHGMAAREMDRRMEREKAAKAEMQMDGMQMGIKAAADIGTRDQAAIDMAKAARVSRRVRYINGMIRHRRMHQAEMAGRDLCGRSCTSRPMPRRRTPSRRV